MKINLELEVGVETGIVAAALENTRKQLETNSGSLVLIQVLKRLEKTLESSVQNSLTETKKPV